MTDRKLRVFLCHASQDKPVVRELYQRLLAEGWIDPWLDEEKLLPGHDWNLEIKKAVESSDLVLVCLSNQSVNKEGSVQKELRMVLNVTKNMPEGAIFLIPLKLENCEMPQRLRKWQGVDYFPPANRVNAYNRLLASLRLRADKVGVLVDSKFVERTKPIPPIPELNKSKLYEYEKVEKNIHNGQKKKPKFLYGITPFWVYLFVVIVFICFLTFSVIKNNLSPPTLVSSSTITHSPSKPIGTANLGSADNFTQYITITQNPTITTTPVLFGDVLGDNVNVRSGPGVIYPILATYQKGEKLEILERNRDGTWFVVLLNDGREGWISAAYINPYASVEDLAIATPPFTPTPIPTVPPEKMSDPCRNAHRTHDLILRSYGTSSGDPDYAPEADLNGDGTINIVDMGILIDRWPADCPSP